MPADHHFLLIGDDGSAIGPLAAALDRPPAVHCRDGLAARDPEDRMSAWAACLDREEDAAGDGRTSGLDADGYDDWPVHAFIERTAAVVPYPTACTALRYAEAEAHGLTEWVVGGFPVIHCLSNPVLSLCRSSAEPPSYDEIVAAVRRAYAWVSRLSRVVDRFDWVEDDWRAAPAASLRSLCDFLGLPSSHFLDLRFPGVPRDVLASLRRLEGRDPTANEAIRKAVRTCLP